MKTNLSKEQLDRGEQAAIRAGYSPKSARRTAARLLRDPEIIAQINKALKEQGAPDSEFLRQI